MEDHARVGSSLMWWVSRRLTAGEITEAIGRERDDILIYASDIRSVLDPDDGGGRHRPRTRDVPEQVRYRYFRKPMSGEIVALERAFVEASGEAGDA